VARHTNGRRSAIDEGTAGHPGYAISQRIRKRVEEAFGWAKTVAGLRKLASRIALDRLAIHSRDGRLRPRPPTQLARLGCPIIQHVYIGRAAGTHSIDRKTAPLTPNRPSRKPDRAELRHFSVPCWGGGRSFWSTFLKSLARRGLSSVKLVISDADGANAAIWRVFVAACRLAALPRALDAQRPRLCAQDPAEHGGTGAAPSFSTARPGPRGRHVQRVADQLWPKSAKLAVFIVVIDRSCYLDNKLSMRYRLICNSRDGPRQIFGR
jgi:hypothetical protein